MNYASDFPTPDCQKTIQGSPNQRNSNLARPISTKFCTDLPTNSGKVLNTSMTLPTQLLDPGVPQTLKPKWVTGEKTLCNVKCPDGWCKLIKFFLGSAGAQLASIIVLVNSRCIFKRTTQAAIFDYESNFDCPHSSKFCPCITIAKEIPPVLGSPYQPTWPPCGHVLYQQSTAHGKQLVLFSSSGCPLEL